MSRFHTRTLGTSTAAFSQYLAFRTKKAIAVAHSGRVEYGIAPELPPVQFPFLTFHFSGSRHLAQEVGSNRQYWYCYITGPGALSVFLPWALLLRWTSLFHLGVRPSF